MMSSVVHFPQPAAVIFDLDGVLTDTAELHFQSWVYLTDKLGIPFSRALNEDLRGRSREESLDLVLDHRRDTFDADQKAALTHDKNEDYLRRVAGMTAADAFPGVRVLLEQLRAAEVPCAVASSSRNAVLVLERLALAEFFSVVVDGNIVPRSKPDPAVFLTAAERLGCPPSRCVVLEDAAAGVAGARAAGMKVIGIGPAARVGAADRVVAQTGLISAKLISDLLAE